MTARGDVGGYVSKPSRQGTPTLKGVQDGRPRIQRQRTSARGDVGGRATGAPAGSPVTGRAAVRDGRSSGTLSGRVNRAAATSAAASITRTKGPQRVGQNFG